ncbi:MAG: esterase family protein [Bacteroidaceae bacterium]|nr:esterase family protein [Bacteroidaceae bacterium]
MSKSVLLLCFVVITTNIYAGKIVTDSINSTVLKSWVKYNIYLPDSYTKTSDKYPALYLLHGLHGGYYSWEKYRLNLVADLKMRNQEVREMVIIMPNAGGPYSDKVRNGYFDVDGWKYETFFFEEFMPHVEKKYRVIGDKGHRAVSGLSMGGSGTITYGMHHPELFSACYNMSGWVGMSDKTQGGIYKTDCPEPERKDFKSDIQYATSKSVYDNRPVPYLAKASKEKLAALRTVKWYIDVGDDDFLLEPNVDLFLAMRKYNIKCELRVQDGIHNQEYWYKALYTMLPFVDRCMDK